MIATDPKAIGLLLKSHRTHRGLTQAQAGEPMGLDQTTVSAIENGTKGTRLDTVFRYCAALGVEISVAPITANGQTSDSSSGNEEW